MTVLHLRGVFLPEEQARDAWLVDGRLTFEPYAGEAITVADRGWVLPGFVDAHCHVGLGLDGVHLPDLADQLEQGRTNRDVGALLLRDAGSPVDNRAFQEQQDMPRRVRAGQPVARTRRYIRDLGIEIEPDELVAAMTGEARRGDGWVKIAADWIDRGVGDLTPTFPDDVLAEAFAAVHAMGVRVAAHVFGEAALPGLIAAGIDSIEHGTGITPDLIDDIAAIGACVVPTLINIDNNPGIADQAEPKFPAYAAHMRDLHARSRERARAVWEAGIPFFLGTDAGSSLPHGLILAEVAALVGAGIPLADVVAQGTWKAREWLGFEGLVEGAYADLVVYADDPRSDLATLHAPERIVVRGAVVA